MPSPKPSKALLSVIPDLVKGEVGILPTDTLYGIVGSALSPKTVARIYALRRRNPAKPMIVLIGDLGDLARFGVRSDRVTAKVLKRVWPGKVSVILPLKGAARKKFRYLHRGTHTLAFRMPKNPHLRALLRKTGPLAAPSANFEGMAPAKTVREAKKYFGEKIKFYVDAGTLRSRPSTLIKIEHGAPIVLRQGAVKLRK